MYKWTIKNDIYSYFNTNTNIFIDVLIAKNYTALKPYKQGIDGPWYSETFEYHLEILEK